MGGLRTEASGSGAQGLRVQALGPTWRVIDGGYGVPLRVPLKGSIGFLGFRVHGVVIDGVISRVTIHIRGLLTPLITTNEPPSRAQMWGSGFWGSGFTFWV